MNTTTTTACPDEPDDSAESIARLLKGGGAPKHVPDDVADLLKRQAALKSRMDKTTPPSAATAESEALQRQALDAESKRMVVLEELAAALKDALTKLPAAIRKEVEDRLTVHTEKHENAVAAEGQSIRGAMPAFNEAGIRFLIHVYGWLTLLLVMGGFLFLVFTRR